MAKTTKPQPLVFLRPRLPAQPSIVTMRVR